MNFITFVWNGWYEVFCYLWSVISYMANVPSSTMKNIFFLFFVVWEAE